MKGFLHRLLGVTLLAVGSSLLWVFGTLSAFSGHVLLGLGLFAGGVMIAWGNAFLVTSLFHHTKNLKES